MWAFCVCSLSSGVRNMTSTELLENKHNEITYRTRLNELRKSHYYLFFFLWPKLSDSFCLSAPGTKCLLLDFMWLQSLILWWKAQPDHAVRGELWHCLLECCYCGHLEQLRLQNLRFLLKRLNEKQQQQKKQKWIEKEALQTLLWFPQLLLYSFPAGWCSKWKKKKKRPPASANSHKSLFSGKKCRYPM